MPGFHRVASSLARRSWLARAVLAGVLFVAAVANAAASDWEARHDLTGAQYQAQNSPNQTNVARTGSLARIGNTLSSQARSEAQDLGREL